MRFASLLAVLLAASVVSGSQYFLNAYTSPLPNGCQVATLADFQSAEFAAQYNVNGYLPVSSAIPQSTDCGIDVLTTVGGTPGRLQADEGAGFVVTFTPGTGPYEGCGSTPYTMTISLGTSLGDGNLLWTTITPAIQGNATVGTFFSPGSVALLKCDTSSYYLNAYASIPNECRLATFAEFQSAEFMNQYNAVGYLNVYEPIPETTDCGVNVMGASGAGRLQLNNGSYDYVLTYPPDSGPWEGCGTGPYTAQIALGTQMANVAWNSLTAAIVSSVDVGAIGTNSVAIVKCGGATPSPPVMTTYLLSQYSNGIPMGCEIATLNDFRSATFAAQYNYNGSLGVYGTIDTTTDCGINVVDVRGGAPGRLLYNKSGSFDFVTVYQPGEDDQLCDGPYGSALSLGMTGDAGVYYSITPALQESAAVGSFYNPGSIALIKCS